jgi:nucleotide-binding universal stress UspA family protein
VRFGNPVREILIEAETFGADTIALTTSGRRRLRHLVSRSLAARICRKSPAPVLLLRAPRERASRLEPKWSQLPRWGCLTR